MFYGKGEVQYFASAMNRQYSTWQAPKLLMSEIIRHACENQYRFFNFGASGGNEGVEKFKSRFGGEKREYIQLRVKHKLLQFLR